ncbi:MAG: 30S ribosomal protein S13 [Candidatus Micrarchaeota archaeon]
MGSKKKIQKKAPEEEKSAEVKVEEKKKAKPAPRKEEALEPGLRGIVRVAGKDMRGNLKLSRGLMRVRGFGHTMKNVAANAIAEELGISPTEKVGKLSDEQIERIDKLLTTLHTKNVPPYLLNRRKDPDTGKDVHVIMNDLAFTQRQDIEREKKLYTWRGYRHAYGKKVRGQRTRNTGRKGMALGVMRKTILAAAAAAKAGAAGKPGAPGAPAAGAPAAGAPAGAAAAPKAAPAPAAKEAKK